MTKMSSGVRDHSGLSYCGQLVKDHDPDRFLLSMFLPPVSRESVWSLCAFNYEISKTREVVSESTLGLMRLQWWRDAIKNLYEQDTVLDHEVLKPLADTIKKHDLPREQMDKLLYAREFDLEDVLPGNLEGLMNYADFTTQPLFELIIKATEDDPAQYVMQPIAINYALAGILRATVFYAQQHRVYLPEDLMQKYNVPKEEILDKNNRENIKKVIQEIVDSRLPVKKSQHVFLRASEALSEMYFKQIIALDYDVFSADLLRDPKFKVLRLFWKTKIM